MQIAQKNFYKKLLGRVGEKKAVDFLKDKGYKILETNYKTHIGEIDIIAEDKGVITFVEVKLRSSYDYGTGAEAVNHKKQEKYFKVATEYLVRKGKTECSCRFDVVEIQDGQINLIIDAFCM